MKQQPFYWLAAVVLAAFFASCGGAKKDYQPFAGDNLARELDSLKNFSIILYDQDIRDGKYYHKYKVLIPKDYNRPKSTAAPTTDSTAKKDPANLASKSVAPSSSIAADSSSGTEGGGTSTASTDEKANIPNPAPEVEQRITDWKEVTEQDFTYHSRNMGMEIIAKENGEMTKAPSPPGYTHFVGNPQYGQWQSNPSTGETFWSFYGKYMLMQQALSLFTAPRFGDYDDYRRNYYSNGRPYYGSTYNGRPQYGTGSWHNDRFNPSYNSRVASNPTFRDKVNGMVEKSKSMPVAGVRSRTSSGSGRSSFGTSSKTPSRFGSNSSSYSSSGRSRTSSSSSSSRSSYTSSSSSSRDRSSSSSGSKSSWSSSSSGRSSSSARSSSSSSSSTRRSSSSSSSSSRRSSSSSSGSGRGRRR